MTIIVKRSTDVGAPVLSGQAGALLSVLDFCLVTGLGWVKTFTGTNKAIYRAPTGNRMSLRVDDSNAQDTRVYGFVQALTIDTGIELFPNAAQFSGGLYWLKSSAASAAARRWHFFSDGVIFYLLVSRADSNADYMLYCFGDIRPTRSGDLYATVLFGNGGAVGDNNLHGTWGHRYWNDTLPAHYLARAYTQLPSTPTLFGKFGDTARAAVTNSFILGSSVNATGMPFPLPLDGGMAMSRLWAGEPSAGVRGLFPGLWYPLHTTPLNTGDVFTATHELVGRTFETFSVRYNGTDKVGQLFIETSDTWG